jgi:hypothetical protein
MVPKTPLNEAIARVKNKSFGSAQGPIAIELQELEKWTKNQSY